ncbi:thiol reductant ABC exporter subunit CydC [Rhodoblastus sphagnicola]|uniref:Thiol reductant ABC exporter subunit CydC n=1 Tax=Rhodoblastus sphagnicola TaxID=333368 RepID=A0A2S6MW98_9HYPH|nr:thiol reductant ABC exporter subunit CydC [Rhodoblastus sphagnicola]MBB4196679.1 ATP-binding cassette subfamily C protein CydC [Rhodoblastus sphagnicola]PPQ26640.1 thiol reductant ABC exporter subunit CydC [Rhodoblastus sphagnicola]
MTNLLRLLALYRPYALWIGASVLISLASLLANIGLIAVAGWFITAMAAAGLAGVTIDYFTPAALIRALAILRSGGRYVDRLISHEATFRLMGELRGHIFASLEPLAPAALADLRSGDITERLRGDIDRLEHVFLRLVSPLVVAWLVGAILVAALARWNGAMALAAAAIFLLAGVAAPALGARAGRAPSRVAATTSADLRARLTDDIKGLAPLLATGADARHIAALERKMDDLLAAEAKVARVGALGQACVGATGELAALAVLAFGAPLLRAGALKSPDLAMAVLAALAALEAFAPLAGAFGGLFGILASADRVFGLIDRKPEVEETARPLPPPARFNISFHAVSLTYPGAARPALTNIDLEISEGARIAFVGASGAGKSSLADLLMRFRDPSQGEIRLGGVALKKLSGRLLHSRIVVVRQNPHLFAATVAENLRLAKRSASDAELWAALASVDLEETIRALPLGLEAPVGAAGEKLSGGQAKRLGLARALLSDAPILFLDEPTEGLDATTAQRILAAVLRRAEGRTLLIATHRPAEMAAMEDVIALDGGARLAPKPQAAFLAPTGSCGLQSTTRA